MNKNELFISKALKVHENKYDYSKSQYINSKTKVCIICPEHGEFLQTPEKHIIRKQGCPTCGNFLKGIRKVENRIKKKFEGLVQPEDYKLIPTTKGHYAIVDNGKVYAFVAI